MTSKSHHQHPHSATESKNKPVQRQTAVTAERPSATPTSDVMTANFQEGSPLQRQTMLAQMGQVQGNQYVQRFLAESTAVQRKEGDPAPATAGDETKTKQDAFVQSYKTWLEERLTEVAALKGNDVVSRVRGILSQIESVSTSLIAGQVPELEKLSKTPDYQENAEHGYVPPLLIGVTRKFIQILEKDVADATKATSAETEGSLYEDGVDWNARLGVPQYRTQSDNLATPEATCNVTAFSMAMERLGYSRSELVTAITALLKPKYLLTKEGKEAAKDKKPEEVEVPDTYWETEAKSYLHSENQAEKNYQKLRGGKKNTTNDEKALAGDFKNNAQMEDLLDFFLHLKSITRTTINSDSNPKTVLNAVNGDATMDHASTKITTWGKDTKQKIKECIDKGGAAIYSFYHKGKGETGTHIISVQAVTDTGLIVDDPYGKMNSAYSFSKAQDAYAPTGKTGASSRTDTYKNKQELSEGDDWKVGSAQNADSAESLGDSYEVSDDIVKGAFYYVLLLERAKAKETPKK